MGFGRWALPTTVSCGARTFLSPLRQRCSPRFPGQRPPSRPADFLHYTINGRIYSAETDLVRRPLAATRRLPVPRKDAYNGPVRTRVRATSGNPPHHEGTMRRMLRRLLLLMLAMLLSLAGWTGLAQAQKPAASLKVPEGVVFEPGIEYANPDGQHLQLDLARPKDRRRPVPGGALHPRRRLPRRHPAGLRRSVHATGRAGLRRGDGELSAGAEVPVSRRPIHDVKAAVRWLRANARKYQIDPERIGVTGGSAGGHLAQFLGVTADVKAV